MSGRKMWVITMAVWFLLWGLLAVTNIKFELQNVIMGVLAIAIAVLVAFDK